MQIDRETLGYRHVNVEDEDARPELEGGAYLGVRLAHHVSVVKLKQGEHY